jgi:NADPH2:quinone reductase
LTLRSIERTDATSALTEIRGVTLYVLRRGIQIGVRSRSRIWPPCRDSISRNNEMRGYQIVSVSIEQRSSNAMSSSHVLDGSGAPGAIQQVKKESEMRAAFYTEQGPAKAVFQIGSQPTPEPGPGEVKVRLRTSGVNPSDWKVRKGGFGRGLAAPVIIPHSDGAGVIEAVGAGVAASRIGERVWIWNGQWKRAFGTAAEYISLPSAQAVLLPDEIDFAQGACLGIPALTAMRAIRLVRAPPGETILIAGGAGAVANLAIQLAKARGAKVIATASGDVKAKYAREAGADEVINYRTEDVGARIKSVTGGRGVGAVVEMDLSRNAKYYPEVLSPHAIVAVYGMSVLEATLPSLWLMQNSVTVQFLFVYEVPEAERLEDLKELTGLLEKNALVSNIAHRYPLEQAAEAHDAVEGGKLIGNVILDIP